MIPTLGSGGFRRPSPIDSGLQTGKLRSDFASEDRVLSAPISIGSERCQAARTALGLTALDVWTTLAMKPATLAKFEAGGDVRVTSTDKLRELSKSPSVTFAQDGRSLTL